MKASGVFSFKEIKHHLALSYPAQVKVALGSTQNTFLPSFPYNTHTGRAASQQSYW